MNITYNNLLSIEYSKKLNISIKAYEPECPSCNVIILEFPNGYRIPMKRDISLTRELNSDDVIILDKSNPATDVVY